MKLASVSLGAVVALALAGAVHAETLIDTTPSWDGSNYIWPFGDRPNTPTYGQVVTVPITDPVLAEFSFYMRLSPTSPEDSTFRGYVAQFDAGANSITGPLLYTSSLRTVSDRVDFTRVTFDTGGLSLSPGQQYVLFASVLGEMDSVADSSYWGLTDPGAYAGGELIFSNFGGALDDLDTVRWENFIAGDMAFDARFAGGVSPVPEAGPLLGAVPFLGLLGYSLRRRFQRAA